MPKGSVAIYDQRLTELGLWNRIQGFEEELRDQFSFEGLIMVAIGAVSILLRFWKIYHPAAVV